MAVISRISPANRTGEKSTFTPQASFAALFSEGPIGSPVSRTSLGECNTIKNRGRGETRLTSCSGKLIWDPSY
jgi:hypothetical protein